MIPRTKTYTPHVLTIFGCAFLCLEANAEDYTDSDGKQYRIAGHNARDAEVMEIDGKRYTKCTPEFEPDIIIDDKGWCEIGSMRRRKDTQKACQTKH
jgi:hypothetical protein